MHGDLISREAVWKLLNMEHPWGFNNDDIAEAFRNAPAVDAVKVVRCKDCVHARPLPEDRKPYYADGVMECLLGRGDPNKGRSVVWYDDFCSDGNKEESE